MVRLSASGGPFQQSISPAILNNQFNFAESPLTESFIWETRCEHVSDSYYQVIFRGQDDSRMGLTGNASLQNLRIKILGPPLEDVTAIVQPDDNVNITWEQPYSCEETVDDYFIGFKVYRREGPDPIPLGSCENGLEGRGYEVVRFLTQDTLDGRYTFIDETVERGRIYCYRVTGNFAQRTGSGQPFNIVESIASDEVCVQLNQDIPLITEVSVLETNVSSGSISVSWAKPNPTVVDTILNSGPYSYRLSRSINNIDFNEVTVITTPTFGQDDILNFIDTNLNTTGIQYYYQVEFDVASEPFSISNSASSVFSAVSSTDMQNNVACTELVPWVNVNYYLEREEIVAGQETYVTIDQAESCDFQDRGLMNDTTFCYRVRTEGLYGLGGLTDSLINFSQVVCGSPLDTVGPCAPLVMIENPCDEIRSSDDPSSLSDRFLNLIQWNSVRDECEGAQDVVAYNVYFASDSLLLNYELIGSVEEGNRLQFEHLPEGGINGCYAVSALDRIGNEGPIGPPACIENCPIYILPNAFTPNGDGANDLFYPRENLFVAEIDFKLFNRWGNLIFETTDPEINWDGTTASGNAVEAGTYYYTCRILERGINGLVEADLLRGHIQLFK